MIPYPQPLSGPLKRDPFCDMECDWEVLSCPVSHVRTGRSSEPPHPKPLRGLNRAIVVLGCRKPFENKRETKTQERRDSQLPPLPRLNSPRGSTKPSHPIPALGPPSFQRRPALSLRRRSVTCFPFLVSLRNCPLPKKKTKKCCLSLVKKAV